MAPSKLQKAIGAVKDRTTISLAKVGSSTSLAELEIAIVKATRHEEYPADERHIREIISLTTYSRGFIGATVSFIARRLNKTKNWVVALKTLILVHRLFTDGDPAFEQEIFFSTRRGTRILNLSDFRDAWRSDSWDYSAFVRTFALYLDERLEYRMQGQRGKRSGYGIDQEDGNSVRYKTTPVFNMRNHQIYSRMHHLQQLLQRFLACRPTGAARNNRIVIVALYQVVKESFQVYHETTEIMGIIIDRFMEMHIPECSKVHEMFCRSAKQFVELDLFYNWCKKYGIARSSEYPEVERISHKKLDLMDEFIRERSSLARTRRIYSLQRDESEEDDESKESEGGDANVTKALPEPESEEAVVEAEPEKEPEPEPERKQEMAQMGDLLNLWDEAETSEDRGDRLALALFDCEAKTDTTGSVVAVDWQAIGESADWETALMEAASSLAGGKKASLGGGFDALMLDGMYQQGEIVASVKSVDVSGSASSVALPLPGSARQAMLALPGPEGITGGDPFAASLLIPPPAYVQMSDLDKKQNLLIEEQVLWQNYAKDGMQGQAALDKLQTNPAQVVVPYNNNLGPYPQNYSSFG